jgi:hypothetical protein
VRPYVYSHSVPITNYGHNNQSIGHQWGVISKNLLLLLDTIKAGILLMQKLLQVLELGF